ARELLDNGGYTVLEAENGDQALELANRFQGTIHLLLSDVVMPGISGPDLAAVLARSRPDMKAVFMSGYMGHGAGRRGLLESGLEILQKPFTRASLLRHVSDALESADLSQNK
ncbi:MAG: response regulator, partial [Candidatus Acidiferrales bacterium]